MIRGGGARFLRALIIPNESAPFGSRRLLFDHSACQVYHFRTTLQPRGLSFMVNLFEAVRSNPSFNKLEIGDLLFAEYTCPVSSPKLDHWTQSDFLVHVLSGK